MVAELAKSEVSREASRPPALRLAPSAIAGCAALACSAWGRPVWVLAWLTVFAVLLPVAGTLSTRLMVALVGSLGLGVLISVLAPNAGGSAAIGVAVAAGLSLGVIMAARRPDLTWQPAVSLPDTIVLAGSGVLLLLLLVPYVGVGAEGVLLDLSRGFDNLMHLSMFLDAVHASESPATAGYPNGFHYWLAIIAGAAGQGMPNSQLIPVFALLSACATTLAVCCVGLTTVAVANEFPDSRRVRSVGVVAATVYSVWVILGGLFSGVFELGHVAFLMPASVVLVASWVAARRPAWSWRSVVPLGAAMVGVAGSYPPLAVGLVPAAIAVVWPPSRKGMRGGWGIAAAALVLLFPAAVLFRWRGSLEAVLSSTGENATSVASGLLAVGVILAVVYFAVHRGVSIPVGAWGPFAGLAILGASISGFAAAMGIPLVRSYYGAKILQAAWIAGVPLAIGLSAMFTDQVASQRSRRRGRLLVCFAGMAATCAVLVLIPQGRYWTAAPGWPGIALFERRVLEAGRAEGLSQVVALGSLLGEADKDQEVIVLLDPQGWSLPVISDGRQRYASVPSVAVNVVAGSLSSNAIELSRCIGNDGTVEHVSECVSSMLGQDDLARVVIVVNDSESAAAFNSLTARWGSRARIGQHGDPLN